MGIRLPGVILIQRRLTRLEFGDRHCDSRGAGCSRPGPPRQTCLLALPSGFCGGCLVWFGFGFVFLIGGQRLEARRFHIKGCFSGDFYGKGGFLAVRLQSHPDPRLTSEASLQPGALLLATVPTPPYCLTQAAASVECETPNLFQPWRFEGGQSGRT